MHYISDLYAKYEEMIRTIMESWDSDRLGRFPEIGELILSERGKDILVEFAETDPLSFRFRYPTTKNEFCNQHRLQKISWQWDESELFPVTGLPRRAGFIFDHLKVLNTLHDLVREFLDIQKWLDASYAFFSEGQACADSI